MKLHWSPRSPFVRKVMVVLNETGQIRDVELVRNPVAMDKPNPVLMIDNPLSKIPTLVLEGGEMIYDSRVICEYLDGLHDGERLFPAGGSARFRALTLQALGDGLLDIALLWRHWASDRGLPVVGTDDRFMASMQVKVSATLDKLETLATELHDTPLNIGHVSIGCALSYLDFRWRVLDWRTGRSALAKWHETFEGRPSMQATQVVDDTPFPTPTASEAMR